MWTLYPVHTLVHRKVKLRLVMYVIHQQQSGRAVQVSNAFEALADNEDDGCTNMESAEETQLVRHNVQNITGDNLNLSNLTPERNILDKVGSRNNELVGYTRTSPDIVRTPEHLINIGSNQFI